MGCSASVPMPPNTAYARKHRRGSESLSSKSSGFTCVSGASYGGAAGRARDPHAKYAPSDPLHSDPALEQSTYLADAAMVQSRSDVDLHLLGSDDDASAGRASAESDGYECPEPTPEAMARRRRLAAPAESTEQPAPARCATCDPEIARCVSVWAAAVTAASTANALPRSHLHRAAPVPEPSATEAQGCKPIKLTVVALAAHTFCTRDAVPSTPLS